jgi:hypothetical protein
MIKKQTDSPTTRVGRSPSYPGLALAEAIEKAKALWHAQRAHPTSVKAVRNYLGYASDNGAARRTLAALTQYGLLAEEGKGEGDDRLLRVTEEARKLSLLPEGHPDTIPIIRELAMRPRIYGEMISKWPNGLPSDQFIQIFLTVEKKYNIEAVPGLIRDFRKTYAFAQLGVDNESSEEYAEEEELGRRDERDETNYIPGSPKGTQSYTLPISGGRVAYLNIPPDMSLRDFDMVAKAIELVRMSVVDEDESPTRSTLPGKSKAIGEEEYTQTALLDMQDRS